MIRKTIIAVLLTCTIATGALWAASYWTTPSWRFGDSSMRHNPMWMVATIEPGILVSNVERRGEWKAGPLRSHCGFFHSPSKKELFAGIHYEVIPGERWRQPDADDESAMDEGFASRTLEPLPIASDVSTLSMNESGQVLRTYPEGAHGTLLSWTEYTSTTSTLIVWVPLWIPSALLGIYPTLVLTRAAVVRHRRRRSGLCLRCGYNLMGNTSGICSECGTPNAATTAGAAGP